MENNRIYIANGNNDLEDKFKKQSQCVEDDGGQSRNNKGKKIDKEDRVCGANIQIIATRKKNK